MEYSKEPTGEFKPTVDPIASCSYVSFGLADLLYLIHNGPTLYLT